MGVNPRAPHVIALRRPFSADSFLFIFFIDEAQRAPPLARHRPIPGRETRKADAPFRTASVLFRSGRWPRVASSSASLRFDYFEYFFCFVIVVCWV